MNNKHLKSLQDFQDKFIRKLLRLAKSTPKAIINWDIGLQPMKWRIAYKKLVFYKKFWERTQLIYAERQSLRKFKMKSMDLLMNAHKFAVN